MSAIFLFSLIVGYFSLLIIVSYYTSRTVDSQSFFLGNRKAPWYIIAFGMIGASLSGVTFISVPGWVGESQFTYLQMILGYLLGYFVIANVLIPVYYQLKLPSIYTYLDERFGNYSYKTGAVFFLLSRSIGSAFRLFLVANVLYISIFQKWNIPFWLTVVITISLIWLYTHKGGIKTIIWTDTLQTIFMLCAVIFTIIIIGKEMGLDIKGIVKTIKESEYSRIWEWKDWRSKYHFVKQFLGGAFIAIVMTGLDQDMMQKNLSCRNVRDAKKNIYMLSLSLIPVNLIFLSVGALLFTFAHIKSIPLPENSDDLYPLIATGGYLPSLIGVLFFIGIIAAAFSSADSTLTSLTTSFTIDVLNGRKYSELKLNQVRKRVHILISCLMIVVILLFRIINNQSVISAVFTVAGYTYGPLLGLYTVGLFTNWKLKDRRVPLAAIMSPVLSFVINKYSTQLFNGYKFGFELLVVNGLIMVIALWILKIRES